MADQEPNICVKYALHKVVVIRDYNKSSSTQDGYSFEKGDFIKMVLLNKDVATLLNEHSHSTSERYYEPDADDEKQDEKPKAKGKK